MIERSGNGRFIFLAALTEVRCSYAVGRVQIIQTGNMSTSQMIFCHFLIFDFANVATDPVDEHSESFESVLHGNTSIGFVEYSTNPIIT